MLLLITRNGMTSVNINTSQPLFAERGKMQEVIGFVCRNLFKLGYIEQTVATLTDAAA